jgi:hypothetical protein
MLSKVIRNSALSTADNTKCVEKIKECCHYFVILRTTIKETVMIMVCRPVTTVAMLPPA